MKFIPSQLELELDSQENNPFNIPLARNALEQALIHQFNILADGIFAWLLLQGTKVSKAQWWDYYLTHLNRVQPRDIPMQLNDANFQDFCKSFVSNIAARKIKVIDVSHMNDVEIRIYGGYVKLWDEALINRQLARLGSDLRLIVLGSRQIGINDIIKTLGFDINAFPIDVRFILGQVNHVTALPYAPLFDFKTELVISPMLEPGGVGFNHDAKIVLRQALNNADLPTKFSTLVHESVHILGFSSRRRFSYTTSYWFDDTKRDICRFVQTPCLMDELRKAFEWNFENVIVLDEKLEMSKYINPFLGVDMKEHLQQYKLEFLLKIMKQNNLVLTLENGRIYCPIYEEGRRWSL